MTLQKLVDTTFKELKTFNPEILRIPLRAAYPGTNELEDIFNTNGNAYYQFSTCLMNVLKPKQVVELGGAMGVWDICVLQTLSPDSQLWSITLPENGLEYSYVVDKYPNFHPIVDNDLYYRWEGVDLSKTDVWFIDSEHSEMQIRAELEIYTKYFKKGAILLFDDIHIEKGMEKVWNELKYEKLDLSDPLHYTGFGICKV